ncbi:MAG: MBOAT family protein [Bacteroidales bacterium]|nr:MBOAT family protein [Bacteroidales bacterium]
MLFNSLEFIIFFPIVVALYFAISPKYRWILLLLASYYFYMCWNYKYIILIALSTIIDYIAGILIYRSEKKKLRTLFLLASLGTNLGLLFFFKYFNFFGESINFVIDQFNIFKSYHVPYYNYLLPVGISFYTFQTLSYTIDIYKRERSPEYHFGKFALFVSFFPQLVAGPIERSVNLLPQFHKDFKFDYERVKSGILLMCWGFFKKVVIADRLAEYVNEVYNHAPDYHGLPLILATLFFAFQIYCDFSGYSDIAIGSAKIMGYDLMTNFRRPYLAVSIQDFWRRWHISLSTWFRDYVYIPLGGNRVAKWRWHFNLMATFVISGLWHGANWTFIIWGALHGIYQSSAVLSKKLRGKINDTVGLTSSPVTHYILQIVFTFILVIFGWIFFRANSLGDAILVIKNFFVFDGVGEINLFRVPADFSIALVSIGLLLFIEVFEEHIQLYEKLQQIARPVKWVVLVVLILCVFTLGMWEEQDFLYFQF